MPKNANSPFGSTELKAGNRCMLNLLGDHFMVDIQEVGPEYVKVSFPGGDYPVTGMRIDLEFHDYEGYFYYTTEVVEGPQAPGGGITLSRPREKQRSVHRDTCRVPTDLTAQVRDQVHVRRHNAAVLNLSAGGALIRTEADLEFNSTIELRLSLPGEMEQVLVARILHVSRNDASYDSGETLYGVKFVDPDPSSVKAVNRYVWRRLKDMSEGR